MDQIKSMVRTVFALTPILYLSYAVLLFLLSRYLPPAAGIEPRDIFSLPALLAFLEFSASIGLARTCE